MYACRCSRLLANERMTHHTDRRPCTRRSAQGAAAGVNKLAPNVQAKLRSGVNYNCACRWEL